MRSRSRGTTGAAARLLVAALVAATPVLVPAAAGAQEHPGDGRPGEPAGATPTTDLGGSDLLRAAGSDVRATLGDIDADVAAQIAALTKSRDAKASAKTALAAANAAVARTKARIATLDTKSDQVVIDAFVDPPAVSTLDALNSGSTADATVKLAILDRQSDADADVLTQLQAAEAKLRRQRKDRDAAAATAKQRSADADAAVADLVAAQSQETRFVTAVQDQVAANLSEAEALQGLDPKAAAALRARTAALAGTINGIVAARKQREAQAALAAAMRQAAAQAAAHPAAPSGGGSSSSGSSGSSSAVRTNAAGAATAGLANVACPGGGSITVSSSIAGNLRSLLAAAAGAGLPMCGGGYRDPAAQVALRQAHCGTSYYDIYEAPSSSCSPPTAKPGESMHEQGLAVDFTVGGSTIGGGSANFSWLRAHAAGYGFYNLPSEAWHWSTNGN